MMTDTQRQSTSGQGRAFREFGWTPSVGAVLRWMRGVGWWLRQVSGDAAYENYVRAASAGGAPAYPFFGGARKPGGALEHVGTFAASGADAVRGACAETGAADGGAGTHNSVMARDAFYVDSLRRRYSRVSRCC